MLEDPCDHCLVKPCCIKMCKDWHKYMHEKVLKLSRHRKTLKSIDKLRSVLNNEKENKNANTTRCNNGHSES